MKVLAYSTVGTPDYIAPEVFMQVQCFDNTRKRWVSERMYVTEGLQSRVRLVECWCDYVRDVGRVSTLLLRNAARGISILFRSAGDLLILLSNDLQTYRKIMNFRETLKFPDDCEISIEARDLIERFLLPQDERLGVNGAFRVPALDSA